MRKPRAGNRGEFICGAMANSSDLRCFSTCARSLFLLKWHRFSLVISLNCRNNLFLRPFGVKSIFPREKQNTARIDRVQPIISRYSNYPVADSHTNDTPVTPDIQTSPTPNVEQETAPTSSGITGSTGAESSTDGAPEQIETQVSTSAPTTSPAMQADVPAVPSADAVAADAPMPPMPATPTDTKPAGKQPSMEQVMESDEFAEYMSGAQSLERNALVTGTVVRLEENGGILVDIGSKSEGIIPRSEIGDDEVEVGDTVECLVVRPEDEEGHPILSKRRADFEKTRRDIAAARDSGVVLQGMVKEAVKGGLIVDLLGVSAFVPASHVDQRVRGQLERLVGTTMGVKVIEVDFRKGRDKVIASHRLAYAEEREKRESEAWDSIEKDKIVEGVVRRITEFGAFVDIGGLDGLLHVREMAWSRVDHPSSVVKKGQKLQVLILDIDEERRRVALGLKQLLPDPWKKAAKNYSVGQVVPIKVLRLAPTVAFVELEPGIEAIIPISELSEDRINKPEDAVSIGQEVEGRIKSIQPNQRRITMSLRAAVAEKERRETRTAVREVNQRAGEDGPLSLGDLFGKELRAVRDRGRNRDRDEARERAEEEADDADFEEIEAELDDNATASMDDEVEATGDVAASDEAQADEPEPGSLAAALKNAGA